MIACLFVEPNGVYSTMPNTDLWGLDRDARKYAGSYPVVAHPPCQLWGNFAPINYKRWGGDHNKPGNDGGCFVAALRCVQTCGGVLEHPYKSKAFTAHGIQEPNGIGWCKYDGYYVCEVWQSAYGHKARKRTWLYYCGPKPFDLRWDRPIGTHQIGGADQRGKHRNKPTVSKKEALSTPQLFAGELLKLAALSNRSPQ